ncbi:hypothetical protein E1A91_D11G359000v1 [Gossypium mustelinum]|uniref:Uncharacterized protein n=3 Tax=Gossypium TaxID=3633 RepID=A0A5J5PMS2_GOSBA|nr:hypothetical protein ES319_D11G350500v1 [Gossypium barbadense]TYG47803.1 hypothetical protein ES288_D11G370900v1 [Gossypium darwinii]TYI58447.1 hypothetical protein E1A91_D11G359000v1 [Gossypium mustelinum]
MVSWSFCNFLIGGRFNAMCILYCDSSVVPWEPRTYHQLKYPVGTSVFWCSWWSRCIYA